MKHLLKFALILCLPMLLWNCQSRSHQKNSENTEAQTAETDKVLPKILDFGATWCPPCKMMAPIIDSMEQKYKGIVTVEKVDIDQNHELAQQYEITGVPTLVFLDTLGNENHRLVGFQDAETLDKEISKFTAK